MSIKDKFKSFFTLNEDDDYEDAYEESMEESKFQAQEEPETEKEDRKLKATKKKVVQFQDMSKNSQVVLIEPTSYADAQTIADHLRNKKSVIINLHRVDSSVARRILDFISGNIYAINGDVKRIGSSIFLATPDSVSISGSIDAYNESKEE